MLIPATPHPYFNSPHPVGAFAVVDESASSDETEQNEEAVGKIGQSEPLAAEPEYTREEQQQIQQLQARDREVKAHEAAHMAAAAGLVTGGMSFSYQTGPDGRRYAVGGEVSIDSSPVPDDPQATLDKAQQIQAAALAPAQPSAQDRAVAARATRMAAEARVELAQQRREAANDLPVNISTRSALDAYQVGSRSDQTSVLDQTI